MKTLLILFSFLFLSGMDAPPQQDFDGTTWSGTFNIPDPTLGSMVFKNDTLRAFINGELLETMSYSTSGDTLTLVKISGQSPCSKEKGLYRYTMGKDHLGLKTIKEGCLEREGSFSSAGYDLVK